jgi:hypothetical protein
MAGARVGARAQLGNQYVRRGRDRSSAGVLPGIPAPSADVVGTLRTRTSRYFRSQIAPFLRHRVLARAKPIEVATEKSKRIDGELGSKNAYRKLTAMRPLKRIGHGRFLCRPRTAK